MIVIMAGLSGSGKTTLAHELAQRTSGVVLNKDEIRNALFCPKEIEYSTTQDDFCMKVLFETASYLLIKNPTRKVFIDGRPFSKKQQLDQVLEVVRQLHQPFTILECICSSEIARKRLEESSEAHLAANRNYDLYLRLKSNWQEITSPKTIIDTNQPLADCVELAMVAIQNEGIKSS